MRLSEISKKEFKGRLSGSVKTCPGCKGKGHRADHDEPSDDEYCAVCAGTGKVATKGTSKCPDCKGIGHYADSDEPMDDEYCYTCAGTGEVGPNMIPKYNPNLDPDMEPPPDPAYLKAQQAARANQPELSKGEKAFKDEFGPLTHMDPNKLDAGRGKQVLTQDQKWLYKRWYRQIMMYGKPKGFKIQSSSISFGDDPAILKVGFYTTRRKATNRQLLAEIKRWMIASDIPRPDLRTKINNHSGTRYINLRYSNTFNSGLDLSKTKF